jgi:hypothetical protein
MKELELHLTNPTEGSLDNCEMYAKMALLMFYPFQQLTDLTCLGRYRKKFHQELTSHHNKKDTKFWKKRYQILQNIQDRLTLKKHVRRPRDPISLKSINETPDETKKKVNLGKEIKLWTYCKWDHNSSK